MTTMRHALELARRQIDYMMRNGEWFQPEKVIAAIDAALAAPDPQPVAWMMTADQYRRPAEFYREKPPFVPPICDLVPLYAAPVAPVATAREISDGRIYEIMFEILPPVLRDTPSRQALHLEFARAVLAAAKENP